MAKQAAGPLLAFLSLDRENGVPVHRQLYGELRQAILSGRLRPGERLPSTRTLANDLGLSRGTVVEAFMQLYAEGYVDGQIGAGTFVMPTIPQAAMIAQLRPALAVGNGVAEAPHLSERFLRQQVVTPARLPDWHPPRPGGQAFMIGIPALDAFPRTIWGKLTARLGRNLRANALVRDRHAGHAPLRGAVAAYLSASRGVRCTSDQVLIVNGSQQAISLIAHALMDPGDKVWMEDPGYFGAKGALLGAGIELVPVPVNDQGMDVDAGIDACPNARAAFVTPSHQMPLGITMSLSRRLALLEWSRTTGAWLIEDDYDSEFRYSSRPITALQGLDTNSKVLYTGTFSKVLFPGLRIGYLVVPEFLVDVFTEARLYADMYSPLFEQLLVTEFILEGHFERHVRRMRTLYADRQETLLNEAAKQLDGLMTIARCGSGMHVVAKFDTERDDVAVQQSCSDQNVRVTPLSRQYLSNRPEHGLLLGYSACSTPEIVDGVRAIARALEP